MVLFKPNLKAQVLRGLGGQLPEHPEDQETHFVVGFFQLIFWEEFLGLHLRHIEVPRLGGESEL